MCVARVAEARDSEPELLLIRSTRSTAPGCCLRTTTSWLSLSGEMSSVDSDNSRRTRHSSCLASSFLAQDLAGPELRQARFASSATPLLPSTSMKLRQCRAAPASER